jgi:hypothetical protein
MNETSPGGPSPWSAVLSRLRGEDDPNFWEVALDVLFADAGRLCGPSGGKVMAQVGACSHWLRPHQTRWTADGGFAWPTGYGGVGFSRLGLPELDWSVTFTWDSATASWQAGEEAPQSDFLFRAALPTRTARHLQAAVHTLWALGPPVGPRRPLLQFYGFRKKQGRWACTAYRGDERVYELTSPC